MNTALQYSPWSVAEYAYIKLEKWFQEGEQYSVAFNEWLFGEAQNEFLEQLGMNNLQAMDWQMVIPKLYGWEEASFDPGNIIEYLGADTTQVAGFKVGNTTVAGESILDALAAFDLEIGKPFELQDVVVNMEEQTIELTALVLNCR